MKVLHLTLKKKWFDMIASGEKKEEYREIKLYWMTRLLYKIDVPWGGYMWPGNDIAAGDYSFVGWKRATGGAPVFEEFKLMTARNGYSKEAPVLTRQCLGIEIGEGRPEWGAEPGKKYFVIKLGEKI
jgi:hypothetical protein